MRNEDRVIVVGAGPVGAVMTLALVRKGIPAVLLEQLPDAAEDQRAATVHPPTVEMLVELGLTVKTSARPVSKPGRRLRAQELATKAIEKIIDPAAPTEERAQRRRRLTNGPPEFREARVDRVPFAEAVDIVPRL